MMQRVQRHARGTFSPCAGCRREPVHVVVRGASVAEAHELRSLRGCGERHMVECCACGVRTAKVATMAQAMREWANQYARQPATVPARPRAVA